MMLHLFVEVSLERAYRPVWGEYQQSMNKSSSTGLTYLFTSVYKFPGVMLSRYGKVIFKSMTSHKSYWIKSSSYSSADNIRTFDSLGGGDMKISHLKLAKCGCGWVCGLTGSPRHTWKREKKIVLTV